VGLETLGFTLRVCVCRAGFQAAQFEMEPTPRARKDAQILGKSQRTDGMTFAAVARYQERSSWRQKWKVQKEAAKRERAERRGARGERRERREKQKMRANESLLGNVLRVTARNQIHPKPIYGLERKYFLFIFSGILRPFPWKGMVVVRAPRRFSSCPSVRGTRRPAAHGRVPPPVPNARYQYVSVVPESEQHTPSGSRSQDVPEMAP
jgi:hypothetical protein